MTAISPEEVRLAELRAQLRRAARGPAEEFAAVLAQLFLALERSDYQLLASVTAQRLESLGARLDALERRLDAVVAGFQHHVDLATPLK